ncbi:unnamed protein product [Rotaria sordida]|uniref:Angio-associated migratory cell protein n=1 Tax=Rotaria sordida TaxID=392033 RepID=A0A815F4E5_9BILA|nr:unnamed protein product [Rotaria sordida]CAF3929661.1 unnamed protein product [Rotaria sordida]
MLHKNSPERHAHSDSDDDDNHIHIDVNDAFEVIDIDSTTENIVENQLDDLDLAENMADEEGEEEEENDDALLKISHHKNENSIFTISIDPQLQNRVCTGGEDDRCLLWHLDTGELIYEYPLFDDSVHQICWSFDGKYLCACDMRGQIRCWTNNQDNLPINEVWTFHTGNDIELMRFHPSAHVLFVGTNDSQLWLFKIPSGEYKIMHGGTDAEIITLEILANGKQCVCGYGNGQIKLWDLKQCSIIWQYDNNGEDNNTMNINNKCISMCLNDEQTLVACGSAGGNCRVLNLNNGKLLSLFPCFQSSLSNKPSTEEEEEDDDDDDESTATTIESVAFGSGHLLICGTLSGYIYIWDINTKHLRTTLNLQSGIVKCLLNDGYLLYAACLDGHIRLLDIRNGEPLKEWKSGGGQGCEIMDMVITKDKRHLLCAYIQGSCRVFKLKE